MEATASAFGDPVREAGGEGVRLRPGIRGFVAGGLSVFRGARRIFSDGDLRRLAAIPLVIAALLYFVLASTIIYFSADVLDFVWKKPDGGLGLAIWWILIPVVIVSMVIAMGLLFSTIVQTIGGPFFDRMAIRVLSLHGVRAKDAGFLRGTLADTLRSLAFLVVATSLWLLGLLPVIGLPFAILGMIISNLGLASSAINPALTATGVGVRARMRYVRHSFMALAGMGTVIGLSLMVPLVGLVSIPCAVVGASELYARAVGDRRG
jgi:CysZ protein